MIQLEKYDFRSTAEQPEALMKRVKISAEPGVLIHTCNRVEFYRGQGEVPLHVVNHLFRVVSGLESFFVGETFIQGQIKEQYYSSFGRHKIDASLHRLFQWALRTGKRVRTETALSRGAMSHSHAVVEIIKEKVKGYEQKRFAFIGINKMNRTIMNFLQGNIHNTFVLCNRSFDKALDLEDQLNCKAYKLDHLKAALEQSDIVISGTSAPHAIIKKEHIPTRSLIVFDLAVPCDADAEVQTLSTIQYYNIKRIEQQVDGNKAVRAGEVRKAELIIEEEISRFMEYQNRIPHPIPKAFGTLSSKERDLEELPS